MSNPGTRRPSSTASARARGVALGGVVGGALFGVFDGLRCAVADTLPMGPGRVVLLVAADAFAVAAVTAVLVVATRAAVPWPRLGRETHRGVAWGLAAAAAADAVLQWSVDLPPWVQPPPGHGDPIALAAILALCALAAEVLARAAALMKGLPWLVVAGAGAWVVHTSARELPAQGAAPAGAPDVVVVTLDTTRADHIGVLGDAAARTPTLDGLAEGGALFLTAVSPLPVTGPSHTSLLTGDGPWRHGVLLNGTPIPADLQTLPEAMRAAGWRTGGFVSAFVLDGSFGFARGFDVYDDDFGWLQGWQDTLPGRAAAALGRRLHPDAVLERIASRTVDQALSWLAAPHDGPTFVWVHLFDPHGPYTPPPPWDTAWYTGDPRDPAHTSMASVTGVADYLAPSLAGITDVEWVRAQYRGEISFADQELARLLDALGPASDRILVVAADHGEDLGEHGAWFNHGDNLYDSSVRVPLVIQGPDVAPGARLAFPVELTDVAPTIAELAGVSLPTARDGRSLVPWLGADTSGAPAPRAFARSLAFDRPANIAARASGEVDRPTYHVASLRTLRGRYVLREIGEEAWYDRADNADGPQLLEAHPSPLPEDLAEPLRAEARALLGLGADAPEALDPETRARLEALGYIDE